MSAPRIPNSEQYWKKRGKEGKKVVIYFHDDLDGIYSAITMRNYLEKNGFEIVAYGVVNYQESWKDINIFDQYINVAVDFAENHPMIDVYIDHHGSKFGEDNKDYAIKTATCSAYEGICYQLGIPIDSLVMNSIDMVDSAKYVEYDLSFKDTMVFDKEHLYKSRLHFTASLNQIIKRGCWHTLIEVVHNTKDLSIYSIFKNFMKHYPYNNLDYYTNEPKDFIEDGIWRINEMQKRTRGVLEEDEVKPVFVTQTDFITHNYVNNMWSMNGYQLIGNIAFVPSGTWANAIRARGIIEEDIDNGIVPENQVKFIVLQYGSTIQMVCYGKIDELDHSFLPTFKKDILDEKNEYVVRKGQKVTNLGKYMEYLLHSIKNDLGYDDPSTYIGSDDDITVAGGHGGIGTISNISGYVKEGAFEGVKFLDIVKNKIMHDFSGITWNHFKMSWQNENENKERRVVNRFKRVDDIREAEDIELLKDHYETKK